MPASNRGMLSRHIIIGATALGLAAGAAASPTSEIEKANSDWIAAINAGEHEKGMAMMTDDGAIIAAQGPIATGHAQMRERVGKLSQFPGFHVDFRLIRAEVSIDGKAGYVLGDSKITVGVNATETRSSEQRLLTVWRKDDGGLWKCYLDVVL